MIGRDLEQGLLASTYRLTISERTCHLVTIFGPAGVGKSRLVEEFVRRQDMESQVLWGPCLPFGDSTAYWSMIQIVRQAAGIAATDPPPVVFERLETLLRGEEHGTQGASTIARLLGSDQGGQLYGDIALSLRRFLESVARRTPLTVVIDDLQWAESGVLDIIEQLVDWSLDVPIMVICMAQEEFLEQRRNWLGGKLNVASMLLSPLNTEEGEELIAHLLGGKQLDAQTKAWIVKRTQGYPLFVEELVNLLLEERVLQREGDHWVAASSFANIKIPPNIHALLIARLDRLNSNERKIVERAAVVGEQFHAADIAALSPELASPLTEKIMRTLIRKDLLRADRNIAVPLPSQSGQSYRFRHIMLRDAAYQGIPEQVRAELHEAYASWLERAAGDRIGQFDELIGYHLDQAYRYRLGLGASDDNVRSLAQRAGARLAEAGHRASTRGDVHVTSTLLGRALELLPENSLSRLDAMLDLADALVETELDSARDAYESAMGTALAVDKPGMAQHAVLGLLELMGFNEPDRALDEGPREIERSIQVFEELNDSSGLAKAWRLQAWIHHMRGRSELALAAANHSIELAQEARDDRTEAKVLRLRCIVAFWGPKPLSEVVRYAEEALEWSRQTGIRSLEAGALSVLARTSAMQGDFTVARLRNQQAKAIVADLGELLTFAADSISEGFVELLDDNLQAAEGALRGGFESLQRMGGRGLMANVGLMLARVLLRQERYREAEDLLVLCEELAPEGELDSQIRWRGLKAILLVIRDEGQRAESFAREAITMAQNTEQPDSNAGALADFAEVLRRTGHPDAARQIAKDAEAVYSRKGNTVAARRLREAFQLA